MKIKSDIKEKITAAANALAAEGNESPTNDQVRERMGGGSLSHISPVMREWRESRKAEVVAALEIPADLKKAIETSVGQVWTAASKLASVTVETVRQEAEEAIGAATDERDEALGEIIRLEERIAELQKALADKDQVISQVRGELDTGRGQVAKLASENAALVARLDDRDEQIKGLKTELKESREDHKALQRELVEIARKAGKKD
jgi:chromosome segregation ATPase